MLHPTAADHGVNRFGIVEVISLGGFPYEGVMFAKELLVGDLYLVGGFLGAVYDKKLGG